MNDPDIIHEPQTMLYIADMVTQGAFTIGGGGIIDRR
jgi:hypothetical protein